jgi:ribosomal protein L29
MKTSEKKDLWTKSVQELSKMIIAAAEALRSLKLDKEQNRLKNTRELFSKRKELAVLKTILKAKEEK